MNYSEAIQFLYELRLFGLKFGLENTVRLAERMGRPQDRLRFIHVAGTNGKGSTCAMLESIYRHAGLRTGLFTSPHLVSFAERIQVNRRLISQAGVARLADEIKATGAFSGGDETCPTFFEAVTVMALKYFAEQECDLVIWETGLGGRLDATNIVTPLASVITNVQFDHQQWLGQTLPEIAREKAGIIKENIPIVTAAEAPDVLAVIAETAKARHAPLSIVLPAEAHAMESFQLSLSGEHQRKNAALARRAVEILNDRISVPDTALRGGLKDTHWAGRRQIVQKGNQTFLLDGAHNPAGAQTLDGIFAGQDYALALGMMGDKDCESICRILAPRVKRIYLTPLGSERTADPAVLAEYCRRANPDALLTVCKNLAGAFTRAAAEPFILATGSLYLVGEALELLGLAESSPERALNENSAAAASGRAPIRAVTFDIGGTLIEPWPSVGHIYAAVAARHGFNVSPETLNRQFAAAWKLKKDFSHRKSDWSALVYATFAGLLSTPPTPALFAELFDEFTRPECWHVLDDVIPCLQRLRREGVKLGVVSNWDERLRPLLKTLGLDPYFDTIVISCETGHCKPAPEIFRMAANHLLTPPNAILHIGDSALEDITGAQSAGFQALLLARSTPTAATGTIPSLTDLVINQGN